jgi:type I restriction enzyme S subunit
MNTDRLLALFEPISEAPDAVPRLRRFILDLAVRGKLVEQDPEDEPAAELLARIIAAKFHKGRGSHALLSSSAEDHSSYDLPQGWTLTSFEDYSQSVNTGPFGTTLPQSDYVEGGVPLVNPSHMKDQVIVCDPLVSVSEQTASRLSSYRLSAGDLVIARRGEVGRVALVRSGEDGWLCGTGSFFASFAEEVPRDYLLLFMRSPFARGFLGSEGIGATMTNLNQKILKSLPLPLPPLAEQHRIVAKVNELMALCDRLEAARQQREQYRDRLVAASLQRLNQPSENPEAFRSDARFALQVLPSLTTTPAQIKQLRQTILNLAVRGKLVEQDPEDEPAEELLREMESRFKRLKITKKQVLLEAKEIPFALPDRWQWTRLGQICEKTGSGSTPRGGKEAYSEIGIPFLRSQNVYNDGLRLADVVFIDHQIHQRMAGTTVLPCDLLLNITGGSIGRCAKVPVDFQEANVSQHVAIIRVGMPGMEDFIHAFILSPYFQSFVDKSQTGAGRGGLPKNRMDAIPVALPPLAEQHRIVAKVDELMALCDQLEQQLSQAEQSRRVLLEAVLQNTLAGPEPVLQSLARP